MQQTEHYQLNQWELEDRVLMADFNSDNQKTDAALHGLAQEAAGKADAAALNSLTAKVNQKAEQSALAAETAARQNANNAEQTARIAGDNAEKAAREAADGALGARIDALTPKAGAQFIKTVTVTQPGKSVTIPLGGIDWDQWKAVYILMDVYSEANAAELSMGGEVIGHVDANATPPDNSPSRKLGLMMLLSMFDGRRLACPLLLTNQDCRFTKLRPQLKNLTQFYLMNDDQDILVGTVCHIWGEK